MTNELTTQSQQPTLLEIRMDSKKYPRLVRIPKDDAVKAMVKIVSQAFLYRGQTADANLIGFTASALYDELMAEDKHGAKFLAIEEISIVVKKAVLESDIYISVASLYRAVIEFCKGEGPKIQQEAASIMHRQEQESLRNSVVAPMLQAYAGALVKNSKVK